MIDSTRSFRCHQFIAKCDGSLDRSLRVILDRVMLDIGVQDLELAGHRRLSRFSSQRREFKRSRNQFHKALFTFEDRRWSSHTKLRQHGGEHAIACGVRKGAGFPHRQIPDPRLSKGHIRNAGQIDCLDRLFVGKLHDLGGTEGRRKGTVRHVVPPARS